MEWLTLNYKEDFFLYIDTWDPHEPWNAPHYYTEPYWPDYDGDVIMPFYQNWKEMPGITEEMVKKAHAAYCGEISMVDAWIGNLLRQVEYMGLMDNTAIIFTTDHGFYFGEHDYLGKMVFARSEEDRGAWDRSPLYEEIAAIPLTIYVPGIKSGVYSGLTSAVDLMPTVLDLFEQEIPSYVEGKSLFSAVKDTSEPGHEYVITGCPFINTGDTDQLVDHILRKCVVPSMTTVTSDEWSLLHDCSPGGSELYNLKTDPDQLNNVISQHPDVARDLHKQMVEFMKETNVPQRLQEPRLDLKM
jgi:arylsulfatase A-like enzyme